MTDGTTWLAAPRPIAIGGYHVVLARGLTPEELANRIAENADDGQCIAVAVGEHTSGSLEELLDARMADTVSGPCIGLRLGRAGDWSYAVAYGCRQGEFGTREPVSRGGVHACLLEYEEENGKPVPPQFEYAHDGRLMSAFNLHLDPTWGYEGVIGDPATAASLQDRLTAAGLPDPELDHREVHHIALGAVERFLDLSLPKSPIVDGTLPTVVLESA
ncbi:DUF6461 domain-containing protein [Streptomyces sp. NPDC059708]|uniref:DUF6461 domain-containing protein n=1 Tax=Streptomyces sp. NPDC059708 TaxID=3346916 RepID=UPI0036C2538C